MAAADALRTITIKFAGDAVGLKKASKDGEEAVGRFSKRTQKAATAGLVGATAIAGGITAMFKGGLEGVQEGEEAESRFVQAFSKVPPALGLSADAIEKHAEAIQKNTRFTYEDALAADTLLSSNDAVQKAIKSGVVGFDEATDTVLDLATTMGIDAPSAAALYAKAMAKPESASKLLLKAGVALSAGEQDKIKAWVKSGNVAKAQALIQEKLAEKTDGAAKAAGETTAGQLERAKNAFGEVQESLVVGLLPALTSLLGVVLKFATWAQDNPGKMKLIVIVVGSLAVAMAALSVVIKVNNTVTAISEIVQKRQAKALEVSTTATKRQLVMSKLAGAATKVWSGIQIVFNAIMSANPVVLITLAIIALIVIVVLIATKTDWFQKLWGKAWGLIQGAVSGVFNWLKSNWPLVLAILTGPIGIAVLLIVKNFDRIKGAGIAVVNWLKSNWPLILAILTGPFGLAVLAIVKNWDNIKAAASGAKDFVVGKFSALVDFVKGLPGKLANTGKGMFDFIKDSFRAAINFIIGGWNKLHFTLPSFNTHIPGVGTVGGFDIGLPQIPLLAKGGNIRRGGTAIVGDDGAELLDLPRGARVTPLSDHGGDDEFTVEIHGNGDTAFLEALITKVIVRRTRGDRAAVLAGARRSFAH